MLFLRQRHGGDITTMGVTYGLLRISQLSLSCSQVIRAARHRHVLTYSYQLLGEQCFCEDLLIHNCSFYFSPVILE